jgi:ribulose-5-phosphate 4-epimerase/fuculose-1-phosphate aldolase
VREGLNALSWEAGGPEQEQTVDDYRERVEGAMKMLDGPERTPAQERERRKIEVALGYRLLAANKWGDAGDGHISARDPERRDCFWMLRYGPSYHQAHVRDLVLVGPNGELVEGDGIINVAAYYIHHPILAARPDAVSATHVHTGWGTPFSAEVRLFEPITQESCVFFEDHALFDDEEVQVQSVDAGKRIADALGSNRAIILRNHGLLTTGGSVAEAVGSFVQMERVAEAHLKARNAVPISADAARFAKADLVRFGAGRVAFAAMVARHIGDPSVVTS